MSETCDSTPDYNILSEYHTYKNSDLNKYESLKKKF